MKHHHEKLENHTTFQSWRQKNPQHTLVHAFIMDHPGMQKNWQFGYYDSDSDKITTFVLSEDSVVQNPQDEAFKDPDKKILPIDMSRVAIAYDQAIALAKEKAEELAKGQPITTSIAILQNIAELGVVWNVTLVTFSFNRVNVKVDAHTGEIKKADAESLLNLGEKV